MARDQDAGVSAGVRRIWHPYTAWEEVAAGMWRELGRLERERLLPGVVEFTGNADLYGAAMLRVIQEWPISCEHNLTDTGQNRRAWVGHAACCLETGSPEYLTREAWGHLTQDQMDRANARADQAIRRWYDGRRRLL